MSHQTIKKELQEELAKSKPDLQKVAELSERLVDLDDQSVRFTVDASHVNRLGLELVAKQETALSEIIKNAYDADATEVKVDFKNHDSLGGNLTILDDGHGMNEEELKNAWMRLSTSTKIVSPVSPRFKRKRAGKKGIGRFAVQRLGKELTLKTEVAGNDYGLRVDFNWEDFSAGKTLSRIWNDIKRYPKDKSEHGTQLYINDLRDRWTEGKFSNVWKSVLLLQPPFKISKTDEHSKIDPGFRVKINGETERGRKSAYSIERDFLDHAVAQIYGSIDEKGKATFRIVSKRFSIDETHNADEKFLLVGKTQLEARYFIQNLATNSAQTNKLNRELAREYGGIRVYRNGFRVAPYGDPRNDWLSLADITARRQIVYPANNNNFFGHIEITEEENMFLDETSSREGLVENDAYAELQEFARACLLWAGLRVAEARQKKTSPSQQNYIPKPTRPSEAIKSKLENLEQRKKSEKGEGNFNDGGDSTSDDDSTEDILKDILDISEDFEADTDRKFAEMLEYEGMLRILASLGLTISMFAHELKAAKNGVDRSLLLLERDIGDSNKKLDDLKTANQRVFSLGGYIDSLVSHQESRELEPRSILGIIERFVEQFEDHLNKNGIEIDYDVTPDFIRTCPVHRSEIDSIFFNFLTNATKAIRKANPSEPKILITAKYDHIDDELALLRIRFEDNGIGVDEEYAHRIFNAFFTTSTPNSSDIEGVGTGLGLRIVADIAENYGGGVELVSPSSGYKTCFELTIPAENLNQEEE